MLRNGCGVGLQYPTDVNAPLKRNPLPKESAFSGMNVCALCVQSQRFPKLSTRLNFWCPAMSGTALEMFQRQALTPHARAARIDIRRYECVRALRPKSMVSQIIDAAEFLVSRCVWNRA